MVLRVKSKCKRLGLQLKPMKLVLGYIKKLGRAHGTSPREIVDFLVDTHNMRPSVAKRLTTGSLKRGVEYGVVKRNRNLFQLENCLLPKATAGLAKQSRRRPKRSQSRRRRIRKSRSVRRRSHRVGRSRKTHRSRRVHRNRSRRARKSRSSRKRRGASVGRRHAILPINGIKIEEARTRFPDMFKGKLRIVSPRGLNKEILLDDSDMFRFD